MSEAASAGLQAAVEASLGALLGDPDVSDIHLIEGGSLAVSRRARREVLAAGVDGALGDALKEAGVEAGPVDVRLEGGATLFALTLPDGRWALRVTPAQGRVVDIPALLDAQVLSPAQAAGYMEALLGGTSLVVTGPNQAGREELVLALAHEALRAMPVAVLADRAVAELAPAPGHGQAVAERVELARRLGTVLVVGLDLGPADLEQALASATVAVVSTSWRPGAARTLEEEHVGVQVISVGYAPHGGPEVKAGALAAPVTAPAPAAPGPSAPALAAPGPSAPGPSGPPPTAPARAPSELVPPTEPELASGGGELPPLKPLPPGPPEAWAPDDDDAAPGWELAEAGVPGEPGEGGGPAFLEKLKEVRDRPTFTPRPPAEHPQARQLKGDPLGGISLEPPGGAWSGAADDEEGEG